ncbi:MAG: hypothetical protein IPF87_08300 [Gemmatimonadetes bacterium]|nr:hypothetical protein [Gemmatimonadota bacterium]
MIRTKLVELPNLIIDDESDQAGLNTLDPAKRNPDGSKQRPPTNGQLVELLSLFPRGQYIGYTATPYANAFVDPDDEQDLFPKDFLIPMERPTGYMGIRDFFDPDVAFEDLRADDFAQPEIAFVRRVPRAIGEDDEDLKAALRSYVLGGALKLYRLAADPARYRETQFQHHTMLLHTSSRTGEHGSLAERVKDLWNECAFNTAKGLVELAVLWSSDFAKVCEAQGSEARPSSFVELQEFLANAIKRIETGPSICLVVNSDKGDAPDFSAARVWKVIIGGNKLSRGYTIEGPDRELLQTRDEYR